MSMSKLDVKLDYRTVKFTDYAIDKYQYNFDIIKAKRIGIKLSCYKTFDINCLNAHKKKNFNKSEKNQDKREFHNNSLRHYRYYISEFFCIRAMEDYL